MNRAAKQIIPRSSLLLGLLFLASSIANAQMPATRPQGYVSDFAGVLSPQGQAQLEALCKELDEKTKAQLAIVAVRSLGGRPIEDFSMDLATKWGIGYKGGPRDEKADRGVLLLLAIDDREDRIEVGYGLEPIITDGRAGSILRAMVPYLRNGDYDGALRLGAASIAQPIAQEAGVSLASLAAAQPAGAPAPRWEDEALGEWLPVFLWIFFGIFFFGPLVLLAIPKRFRRQLGRIGTWAESASSHRGSSSGRGGGSGGGFGGFGGGSFGGGGASGRW